MKVIILKLFAVPHHRLESIASLAFMKPSSMVIHLKSYLIKTSEAHTIYSDLFDLNFHVLNGPGNENDVKLFINADNINDVDDNGSSALLQAVDRGNNVFMRKRLQYISNEPRAVIPKIHAD